MSHNEPLPPVPSKTPLVARPTITLPPRSSIDGLFTGAPGASPGPMTLVSSFFVENDPDNDCPSFSQLLSGAMTSTVALPNDRQGGFSLPQQAMMENTEFRFHQNRPAGLTVSQPGMFTIPPGLSPASLLDSPGYFSALQASFGTSRQHMLAQVTARAQAQVPMPIQFEYPSLSSSAPASLLSHMQPLPTNVSLQQQMPPSIPDSNVTMKESSDISHTDQKSQPPSLAVDKPTDDGYNWRKYGQKQVKGSEYPRSYYKCTHPNCPVKKKVERSLHGQVTEIIYKGQHKHPPPSKRGKDPGNSELSSEGHHGNLNKAMPYLFSNKDQESSQVLPDHVSGSSDSEEVGNAETLADGRDDDEPESKRRNIKIQTSEQASSHQTVTEPRIIVQTTSEVDLLDDGYRWRKYGQKVVKGNAYPRSYYKCTNPDCNVRKHIERAASDPKAVVTTYEGKHNHDVPAAKASNHSTTTATSLLRPHSTVVDRQIANGRMEFGNNLQQPIAILRFKEEQIT